MFKTRLDNLGTILGVFWFLNIFKNLSKTRPSLEHRAKKIFGFGQIGNGFGRFLNFENFSKHFEDSTLLGTLDKKISRKIYPKTCWENTFGHFCERFWAFTEFWKFFDLLKAYRRLDPPWNTLKKFSKNLPQNTFKTIFELLGTILGIFGVLETF